MGLQQPGEHLLKKKLLISMRTVSSVVLTCPQPLLSIVMVALKIAHIPGEQNGAQVP